MLQAVFENTVKSQVVAYDADARPNFVNGTLFVEFVADEMFDTASKARQILDELKCLNYRAQMSGPIGNEYAYDFVA